MRGTLRAFRAEAYRMPRARSLWVGAVFLAAVPAVRVWAAYLARAAEIAERKLAGRSAPAALESGDGWAPLVDGWHAGLVLGALLLLVHAARSIASDRDSGVLRPAVTRGVTRSGTVLGRALLAPVLVVGVAAASGAGAFAVAQSLFDFGPLVEDGYELMSVADLRRELTSAVLAALPALLALYGFGLFVSALGRSATGALSVALALYLGFDLFKEVLGDDAYFAFAAHVPSLVDTSAMGEMSGLARGFSDAGFPPALLRLDYLMSLPQAVILVVLACLAMHRRAL
ncbi:MAG: hypothetical protein GY711_23355 [bacterium]|nr:hypothetical protein [bacterium]